MSTQKLKYPNYQFTEMSVSEFYFNIMCAIQKGDDGYVEQSMRYISNNNLVILNPHYIINCATSYLQSPSTRRLQIFILMYYVGFQCDNLLDVILNKKADKYRKLLLEVIFQYAIDHNHNVSTIWGRCKNSIYYKSYEDVYEEHLLKSLNTNKKLRDYVSFSKLMFKYVFSCRTTFEEPDVI